VFTAVVKRNVCATVVSVAAHITSSVNRYFFKLVLKFILKTNLTNAYGAYSDHALKVS
jgi:hypothetical protein